MNDVVQVASRINANGFGMTNQNHTLSKITLTKNHIQNAKFGRLYDQKISMRAIEFSLHFGFCVLFDARSVSVNLNALY